MKSGAAKLTPDSFNLSYVEMTLVHVERVGDS